MKKNYLLAFIALLLEVQITFAQSIKRPDTDNYIRGVEAIQNNNTEKALEYLNKELEDNPNNGYAWAWIAVAQNYQKEYGRALTAANWAIKIIPKEDKGYRAFAYIVRSEVYTNLDEYEKALADLTSAVMENPDDIGVYEKRANLYYYMGKYDLADKDYQKIISIDPGNVTGYMGIGRNANAEKRYEEAIKQFSYVTKLAPKYSFGYSFRAESFIGLKKYNEAIEDIIHAMDIDYNNKAFYLMQDIANVAMVPLVAKLKIQSTKKSSNDYYWSFCLGLVYEKNKAYKKAITYYTGCQKKNPSSATAFRISNCYSELGNFASALKYIDFAIALDSTNYDNIMVKAKFLYESGNAKAAINELDKYVAHYPEFYGYYLRGWYKDNCRDIDGAIEDYTMSIALEPTYAYAYLGRGDMYILKGNTESAAADYRKVIELDTIPYNNSCAQYAYWGLGKKEKAIEFMNNMIENAPNDAGNYYDAACLYSRMGETEKALKFMKTALEKGFRRFAHIEMDDDLNEIRQLPEFKELILKYKNIFFEIIY